MKLKSYFSSSVEAAMDLARRELGENALLVNARPSTPETRHLGAYEVVFGLTPERPAAAPEMASATIARLGGDLGELKRQMEQLTSALRAPLCSALPADSAFTDPDFTSDPTLGRAGASRAVVALVGPPGVGKTTTLVKLAARYGLACRRRPQILTVDVFRVAAADQLRSLASLLGIGCDVVETPLALAQALQEHSAKELILIDTPGFGFRDLEDGADLARLLASHPEMDTHLVLAASTESSDMARLADSYRIFGPSKLIFTRLDETTHYETLALEAARSALPVSFLTTGQQIPDDLEEATRARLMQPKLRMGAAA